VKTAQQGREDGGHRSYAFDKGSSLHGFKVKRADIPGGPSGTCKKLVVD
jgi:hypothetical protein